MWTQSALIWSSRILQEQHHFYNRRKLWLEAVHIKSTQKDQGRVLESLVVRVERKYRYISIQLFYSSFDEKDISDLSMKKFYVENLYHQGFLETKMVQCMICFLYFVLL